MAEGFKLASAFVSVAPDLTGFGTKAKSAIDALTKGLGATVPIGADTGDASSKIDSIRAKLDALKADNPKPEVAVQITDAAAKLDLLQAKIGRLNDVIARPTVSPEAQKAYEELDALNAELDSLNHAMASPKVTADIADVTAKIDDVNAKLDKIEQRDAQVKIKATADLAQANADLDKLQLKIDKINSTPVSPGSGGGGGTPWMGIGIGAAIPAVGSLLPALPGALTGAGAAFGVLGLAISGISPALQAYQANATAAATQSKLLGTAAAASSSQIKTAQMAVSAAQTQAAHDAITSAEAIKNAEMAVDQAQTQQAHDAITSAEQIKNAQQGVAQATQQAAQSEVTAEQQLAAAQYTEQQAQQSLTLARQQAILTLQQLNNAVTDTALGADQAQLNLLQAEQNLSLVNANARSTSLQRAQAALAVRQAEQALKEALQARTNASHAAQTADKQGVAGNPSVVAAQHALAQAHQGVANAQTNLANVEKAGAQAIAKAEQTLADAIRSASWQRVTDAQNVAKAQQGLADTSRNASWTQQADAQRIAQAQLGVQTALHGNTTSYNSARTAAAAYAAQMGLLSPAGQQLVKILGNLIYSNNGLLNSFQDLAAKGILPGVKALVGGISSIAPLVGREITKMGGILSQGMAAASRVMKSSGFQKDLQALFTEGNKFISILGPAIGKFVLAFIDMGVKGAPAVSGLAKMLSGILGGLGSLMTGLAKFSNAGGQIMIVLGQAIGSLGGPLATVVGVIERVLGPVLKALLPVFKTLLQQTAGLFLAAAPGLVAIAQAFVLLTPALVPLVELLGVGLAAGLRVVGGLLQGFATFVKDNITWLKPLVGLIVGVVAAVKLWSIAMAALDFVLMANPIGLLIAAVVALVGGIVYAYTHFKAFRDVIHTVWDAIKTGFNWVKDNWPLLLGIIVGPFGEAAILIIKFHAQIFSVIKDAWNAITSFFTGWWNATTAAFSSALNGIGNALSSAWDSVSNDVTAAWKAIANFFTNWWDSEVSSLKATLHTIGSALSGAWDAITSALKTAWNAITAFFTGFWSGLKAMFKGNLGIVGAALKSEWDAITGGVKTAWNGITSFFKGFWSGLKAGFADAVRGVELAWNRMESVVKTPVNWVISNVYDKLIVRFWNDVAGPVGLPKLQKLAAGGKIMQGTSPKADDVLARVSKGETVVSAAHSRVLAPAFKALGVPGYAGGGIPGGGVVSDIGGAVSGAWDGLTGGLGEAFHKTIGSLEHDLRMGLALPMKAAGKVINSVAGHIPGSSGMAQAMKKAPGALWSAATSWIEGHTAPGGAGKYTGSYGSGVAQWKPDVLKVLAMLGEPSSLAGQVLYQMSTESGGNPNAINLTDSNAAAGDPSRGLLQTIMSTFEAYRSSKLPNDIYNPTANIYAAVNYAMHRYGRSLMSGGMGMGSGHGYDSGGWLMPTSAPVNKTGKPEAVLTPEESAAFVQLVKGLVAGGGGKQGAGMRPGGGGVVQNNFYQSPRPTPEQEAAMLLKLGAAIGVA